MKQVTHFYFPKWKEWQHYKDRNPPWIKLHVSILSSEDWVMLSDASRVLAVASMVLASKDNGRIPNNPEYIKRVAYLNKTPDFQPLIDCGMVVPITDASMMLADASTLLADARPEERREETYTETETDQRRESLPLPPIFAEWNAMASEAGIPTANETPARKAAIKTRMKDAFFRDNWKAAMDKIPASQFMQGLNDRGWKANLDWFLKPDSVTRIMEGKYDNAEPVKRYKDGRIMPKEDLSDIPD